MQEPAGDGEHCSRVQWEDSTSLKMPRSIAGACGYIGKGDYGDRACVWEKSLDNPRGLSVSTEEKQEDSCQCQRDAGSWSCCLFLGLKMGKSRPEKGSLEAGEGEMWAAPHKPRRDPSSMPEQQSSLHKFVWVPPPFASLSLSLLYTEASTLPLSYSISPVLFSDQVSVSHPSWP